MMFPLLEKQFLKEELVLIQAYRSELEEVYKGKN